jgi:hypothetical protein
MLGEDCANQPKWDACFWAESEWFQWRKNGKMKTSFTSMKKGNPL